ncbi:MAG: ribosome small subunit-dependent GTPase A [Thiobacillaceae bacterium]
MNLNNTSIKTQGQVIAAFSRRFIVETAQHGAISCLVQGRQLRIVCGDRVNLVLTGQQGVIDSLEPRASLLYRSDLFRSKPIAANVTQIAVVVAARPSFSTELVQRCMLAAEAEGIASLVVLNKIDLPESTEALVRLRTLEQLGYPVVALSAESDPSPILPYLNEHTTLLIGQSGMGKSTLINALIPDTDAATAEFSEALDSGKHTTTHTRLYHVSPNAALIDSPGLQEFSLQHLNPEALAQAFVDFRPYIGLCRFRDCRHLSEPGCSIRQAVENKQIDPARLKLFHLLQKEYKILPR